MHGPGYAPPQPPRPSTALVVVFRVLFVALPVLSIGFLAWATMLRVACVTRARRDWLLFALSLAALFAACVFIGSDGTGGPGDPQTWRIDVGMALLMLSAFGSVGYFLYADIRRFPPQPAGPGMVYGYPPSVTPQGYAPAPTTYFPPQPAAPFGTTPVPAPPPAQAPTPQPQRPAPARIDQVRAELDELSDFLRGQDQGQDQGQGHGRDRGTGGGR
ncbi:hypothetical protein [Streptomyces kebangsaanensis]|uniref:hypothetical protein n=1 Tax=Streptomyces kebangsaanensis TaxID=864058 RepID=UPI00093C7B29|nr:hypothetical protein [Streptomyces kebangsaanensis]